MSDKPKERDERGRFAPGNSGNPTGRPKRSVEEASLDRFRARYSNGEWSALLDALDRQVKRGNIQAIRLVFEYLLGKPSQPVDMQSDSVVRIIVQHERRNDQSA